MSQYCSHRNMHSTARIDYCPDCKYELYYGDVHSTDLSMHENKLVNSGKPEPPVLQSFCGQCDLTRLYCECDEFDEARDK